MIGRVIAEIQTLLRARIRDLYRNGIYLRYIAGGKKQHPSKNIISKQTFLFNGGIGVEILRNMFCILARRYQSYKASVELFDEASCDCREALVLRYGLKRPVTIRIEIICIDRFRMIRLALYIPESGNRSEARASNFRSHPGLWWNRIKLRLC